MKRKLSLKQQIFIKLYLQLLNSTEAAYRVYHCKDRTVAAQIGYENLRKPYIYEAVRNEIMAKGVSLESIVESAIKSLVEIAKQNPNKVTASESLRANELLLKLQGFL